MTRQHLQPKRVAANGGSSASSAKAAVERSGICSQRRYQSPLA